MKYNENKENGNLVFSKDAHVFDKGFCSIVHVLFGVLVIPANSFWSKKLTAFSVGCEHEVELSAAGEYS